MNKNSNKETKEKKYVLYSYLKIIHTFLKNNICIF